MKSIGGIIKEARVKKKLSRERLEKETKIKKEFIEALEKGDWGKLPEYPVVVGFVKSLSSILKLNESFLLALLRRDYPPREVKINPKVEIPEKFVWTPRLSFILGVVLAGLFIVGYLIYEYFNFIKPPELLIESPTENQKVFGKVLIVKGKTDPDAAVLINNQPTLVGEDGRFEAEIEISEKTYEIVVLAKSRAGKETVVRRKIEPNLKS